MTKGYSSVQVKVRNATSNDPWGPTGTEMSEIAQMTFNSSNEFYEIMDMLDKRLNDRGKNWRHVLKALKVLDYCLHEGSELVVTWAAKNIYIIKTLREFQHIDDDGRDVGQNVRVSAKELTSLILDEERLRTERSDRKTWKSRVTGIEEYSQSRNSGEAPSSSRRQRPQRAQRADEEDAEYKLAIEASKYQEEEDRKKRQSRGAEPVDDDLAKAIKLSKEEEELRRRELEESNAASLFDDAPVQTQPTGFNQGYQQQSAVDWSGNPIDSGMQQQQTGYMNNVYTGYQNQPQQTGFQNGYQNGFASQSTGFDPYGSVQQQPQYQQTQQTGYNPYLQQPVSSPFQKQQTATPEPLIPANTNNPWANNQSQQALQPTPTGSNNPFASSFGRPQVSSTPSKPTLATLQEQQTATNFNNSNNSPFGTNLNQSTPTSFNPIASFTPPPKQEDPHTARLNALLASGEGQDTFGNTGNTRIPAQHTAPGQFVNSAGIGHNRMQQQQTGNNPFLQSQYTGMPQTTYNNTAGGFGGQQVPAATGPAGMNGFGGGFGAQGSSNPFGPRPGQQQKGQGDLIQF